jgi:hypothetical protein
MLLEEYVFFNKEDSTRGGGNSIGIRLPQSALVTRLRFTHTRTAQIRMYQYILRSSKPVC